MRIRFRLLIIMAGAVALTTLTTPAAAQLIRFDIDKDQLAPLSEEMQREVAALHYLLNPYQLHHFFALDTNGDRREWIERWWRSEDPTPTTLTNEMRVEHDKRVRAARLVFAWEEWPFWDHRGEVLIRFGNPDFRQDIEWHVSAAGASPPGESWEYARHDMTVLFEDITHNGKYTLAIQSRGNLDRRRVSGGYGKYGKEGDAGKAIDADFDGPRGDPIVPPVNHYLVYLSEKAQKKINNFQGVLEDYQSTYPFNFNREEMPSFYKVSQFKGGESLNRVEVNLEVQAAPLPALLAGETQKFDVTTVFFDADYHEIDRSQTSLSLPAKALPETGELWYPLQLALTLEEDYYRVAVTVEEATSGRSSSYRSTFVVDDMEYDAAISGILFCSKIAPADGDSPFIRGPLEVIPHPRGNYIASTSIPVYFELYNLEVNADGISSYAVEYWAVPLDSRGRGSDSYAVSRFETSSYGADAPVDVLLDTSSLSAGRHIFHVKITDLSTFFTAERTAAFRLVDAAE